MIVNAVSRKEAFPVRSQIVSPWKISEVHLWPFLRMRSKKMLKIPEIVV